MIGDVRPAHLPGGQGDGRGPGLRPLPSVLLAVLMVGAFVGEARGGYDNRLADIAAANPESSGVPVLPGPVPGEALPSWWNVPFDRWTPMMHQAYFQWVQGRPGITGGQAPARPPRPAGRLLALSAAANSVAVSGVSGGGPDWGSHVWLYTIGEAAPWRVLTMPGRVESVRLSPSGDQLATVERIAYAPVTEVRCYNLRSPTEPVLIGPGKLIGWLGQGTLVVGEFRHGAPSSAPEMLGHPAGLAYIGETYLLMEPLGPDPQQLRLGPFRNWAAWDVASGRVCVVDEDVLRTFQLAMGPASGRSVVEVGEPRPLPKTELGVRVVSVSQRGAVAVAYPCVAGYGEPRVGAKMWQADNRAEPLTAALPGDAVTGLVWSCTGERVLAVSRRYGARARWYASTVRAGSRDVRRRMSSRETLRAPCPLPNGDFLVIQDPCTERSLETGLTLLSMSGSGIPEASWAAAAE